MDRPLKNLQLMLHREYGIEVRKADLLRYAISQLDEFDMDCDSSHLANFFCACMLPLYRADIAAEICEFVAD